VTAMELSITNVLLAITGVLVLGGYLGLIVAPACASYTRKWEKVAAAFLTVFILAGLLVTGAAIGAALLWSYDRWG
jgi:hypothetical protein